MSIEIANGQLFQMPAREWHITCGDQMDSLVQPFDGRGGWKRGPLNGIQICIVRGGTPDDLIAMSIFADAVHRDSGIPVLLMPYLPGARQDRRRRGEALSCKVYADLINRCEFAKVVCVDPHSDVMPALINNCVVLEILDVLMPSVHWSEIWGTRYDGLIAPDAGAVKKIWKVAQVMKKPLYVASKHRDQATGKLNGFSCEGLPETGRFLIMDDICDGGGTFMGLVEAIKKSTEELQPPPEAREFDLYVTHGVFSGDNAENLHKHFGRIYTTDSYEPMAASARYNHKFWNKVRVIDIARTMEEAL